MGCCTSTIDMVKAKMKNKSSIMDSSCNKNQSWNSSNSRETQKTKEQHDLQISHILHEQVRNELNLRSEMKNVQ